MGVPLRRREETRAALLERAADDPRVTGAAVTGSAADGREDRWSDIDLFLGVAADFGPWGEGDFRVVFGEAAPRRASAALLRELHATDPDLARTLAPALTAAASPPETPASPPPAASGSPSRR